MADKRAMIAAMGMAMLLAAAVPGQAAIVSGRVLARDGQPVMGAMVTVHSEDKLRKDTVYTDAEGSYAIRTDFGGKLLLRARVANLHDASVEMHFAAAQAAKVDFTLQPFATSAEASEALAASAHNARLPWNSATDKAPFVSQCMYCHQIGNALTRAARPQSAWEDTIRRMEGYFAQLSGPEAKTISAVLAAGFDGKPFDTLHNYAPTAALASAKIEQWMVGDAMSFIHDTDVGEDDKLYGTDEGHDVLWVLDRKTHKIDKYPLPDIDLPVGGVFSGMQMPIGIFTGKHGPHSMAQTKDGLIWITNALSSTLMSFDPASKAFKTYPIGHDVLYPHTIRADKAGVLWFTNVASNQVGRFNPKTQQMDVLHLPSNGFFRWVSDMLMPSMLKLASWFPHKNLHLDLSHQRWLGHNILAFPYGIDINPIDGSVWYAKLYANKIGRIDAATLEVTEWDTPMKGPRRPRFDQHGVLWIPAFDDSGLMAFDTRSKLFTTTKLPLLAKGEHEVPYALNVHPKTGDIWITANNSDRVLRFKPSTKTFVSYPSPTRVTVLRDMAFTKDGRVCSSLSNLPAYGTEDGVDSFMCIDPDGGDQDRAAMAAAKR
ncbi:MAG: carboxypeptidase regulatory-like domain-containing protein [Pseudomonadota bacterium]